jgi:lipid II:glycine glycyltransferase (peptidoglycan interpeptide bridge formation enzyme)
VLVPVDQGPDAAWKAMEGRSRTAIRKAERSGFDSRLRPVRPDDTEPGSTFRRLYETTMARVGSSPRYLFTDEYYQQLLHGLGPALLMAEVYDPDGVIVAASLVMRHRGRAHYHLAGSDPGAARLGANNLLVWAIIGWAAAEGLDLVHLGGGLTADDNLFRFKRSFGGRAAEFWTGTAVLDESQYRILAEERSSRLGIPLDRMRTSSFFPLYRAEFGQAIAIPGQKDHPEAMEGS